MQYLVALAALAATAAAVPGKHGKYYTTSIVYKTNTYTVTHCAATVTDCPAESHHVSTETVADYTTVCPVEESATETPVYTTASPVVYSTATPIVYSTATPIVYSTATPVVYSTATPVVYSTYVASTPAASTYEVATGTPIAPGAPVSYSTAPAPAPPAPTGTAPAPAPSAPVATYSVSPSPIATGAAGRVAGGAFGGMALVAAALLL